MVYTPCRIIRSLLIMIDRKNTFTYWFFYTAIFQILGIYQASDFQQMIQLERRQV